MKTSVAGPKKSRPPRIIKGAGQDAVLRKRQRVEALEALIATHEALEVYDLIYIRALKARHLSARAQLERMFA